MSAELHALLAKASDEIEGATPVLDGGRLATVRAAARRRRIARRTTESFAGVAAVAVVGVGIWFGTADRAPEPVTPVATPSVSPTPTPTPTPSPTPSSTPTPTGPPVRAESIDDATVLARLAHPRTGEVWQTPELVTDVPELGTGSGATTFLVGTRGDASIYLTAYEQLGGWYVDGLYEVDSDGARLIACPSARTVDLCADEVNHRAPPGVVRDVETFYDTVTLPESIDLGGGFTVTTTNTTRTPLYGFALYGLANPFSAGDYELRMLQDLGPLAVVARVTDFSSVPAVTDLTYGLRTPFGTFVQLDARDIPMGEFAAIRWDDGVVRGSPGDESDAEQTVAPGGQSCLGTTFSQDDAHVPSDWRPAGRTPAGHRVYIPVPGGNPLSRAVRAWQEGNSWTSPLESGGGDEYLHGAAAGYPYTSDAAFLDAHALYATQGPAGEWLLGLRSGALNIVYECA